MATLLITYDLNSPGQNYEAVHEAIKSLGAWYHAMDSIWVVKTTMTTDQANKKIGDAADESDSWFICTVTHDRQGWMPETFWEWLRR